MKALQEKYKDNKPLLNQKWLNYIKSKVLTSCRLFAAFGPNADNAGVFLWYQGCQYAGDPNFLWMTDIALPDPYYILPVLSALTTFIQSKQSMPDTSSPQNKVMLYFMPLFIGYISFTFPAGLVLAFLGY